MVGNTDETKVITNYENDTESTNYVPFRLV